jgi:hypothetical protein
MRWQPWFFHYLFMLAALASFRWGSGDAEKRDAALDSCRVILAGMYFYSGLQKMNPSFAAGVFPWMMGPLAALLPFPSTLLPFFGFIAPFLEMAIGIGLLSKRFRNLAIGLALALSALVLSALGPWGHDWNRVVWPWNIAMAAFAVILFWRTEAVSFDRILWKPAFPFQTAIIILFAVMPAFSFFDLWDSYLSASLYSGNITAASVYVSDSVENAMPDPARRHSMSGAREGYALDLSDWSFDELHVPPYPEKRVFKGIARTICGYAGTDDGVFLEVVGKTTLLGPGKITRYDCGSL